ncbi:MAG: glycosyl hydrolase, repeat-containing protein [Actinomycetia bacterium]|nr:glycosyl hydrolase, repeat-containing protein [Actinomycetes bacterium]
MMPGNGARDPLDDWLDRGIHPLPPPDGTFKAIRRRARNRKMGKLAMAASCAAAVVVTTALVVPSLLAPPAATPVADRSPAASHTTRSVPSKSPSTSAPGGKVSSETPAPSATSDSPIGVPAGSTSGYPASGPVPSNFQPTSVTFIAASTGWAIGQGGTPGSCANSDPYICTSLVFTQDNAGTWQGVKAPDTAGVSGIRFLNGKDGWAYGPELWSTHDFGQTWQQVDTGGMVVTDLETAGNQAFAVFATCSTTTHSPSITFYGTERCTDFTLVTTPAGTDNWTPITFSGTDGGTTLTMSASESGATTDPTIVLQGGTGWLVGPLGQVFTGSLTSGTWTQVSASPCASTTSSVVGSAMLDWSLATGDLIMACNEQESTTIFSSSDGGGTWNKQQATGPGFGVANSLTASPAAPDILATTDGIVALNASGQWHEVAPLTGGFSYVGMTTDGQGVAVPTDASLHQVWMTYNGGVTWAPHSILP